MLIMEMEQKYKEGFEILYEYFEYLPEPDKIKIDIKLKRLGL